MLKINKPSFGTVCLNVEDDKYINYIAESVIVNPRDLFLTIGKKTYSIKTPLDDDVLERVRDLIDKACGVPTRGVDQEDLLILTCLKLAYSLDNATMRLNALLERLEEAGGNVDNDSNDNDAAEAEDEDENSSNENEDNRNVENLENLEKAENIKVENIVNLNLRED